MIHLEPNALNFLRKHDKTLPSIPVYSAPTSILGDWSGGYYKPEPEEFLMGDRYIPFNRGIIIVNIDYAGDNQGIAKVLAHEWRHHWQHCNGWQFSPVENSRYDWDNDYEQSIIKYYSDFQCEHDAMQFQLRAAPAQHDKYLMDVFKDKSFRFPSRPQYSIGR